MRLYLFILAGVVVAANLATALQNLDHPIVLALTLGAMAAVILLLVVVDRQVLSGLRRLTQACDAVSAGREFSSPATASSELRALSEKIQTLGQALREKTAFVDMLLTSIITPMLIVDAKGRIEWLNESMVRLTEQDGKPDAFFGQRAGEFFYGEARETVSEKAIQTGQKQFVKGQMTSRKGNIKYISIASTPILDADGKVRGAFSTIMDFTNIKLKEDHILAQNERIATGARQALEIAHKVAELSSRLGEHVAGASQGVGLQQMRTTEVATAIDEMNATILEVARNASAASQAASRTESTVSEGARIVGEVIQVMDQVNAKAGELKSEMGTLGTQAEGIGRIMAVINDIADQTNLLALNAAIEAARAGAAGRGFAVVADEVRKLAEKTMQATSEVSQYIRAIQDSARTSIQATDGTAVVISQATELSRAANESLGTILTLIGETNDQVRAIATATEEQSAASEQIGRSTNEVNSIAEDTVRAMREFETGVNNLRDLALSLDAAMERMQQQ